MDTLDYAPRRAVDVFGRPSDPTLLLWHGTQTDSRAAVRPLAEQLTGHGLSVVAPDWNSHAEDGGRSDLLATVDFAREWTDASVPLALAGWSLGGVAAAGLTIHAQRYDVVLSHTVCLAGAFMVRDPLSGHRPADDLSADRIGAPFTLVHGLADDVVPLDASRTFAADLQKVGWPVRVVEVDADHGSIAGAVYDPDADRYAPAQDPQTHRVAGEVARHIAAALRSQGATDE